jgi:general secretion pathway protein H
MIIASSSVLASSRRKPGPSGFTLIEILIVVLIISIVTSVGVLTISRNNNKEIELFAKELTQVIRMAEEQAMLQPVELGLMMKDQTYQFAGLQTTENTNTQHWSALDDNVLGQHAIPSHIEVRVDTQSPQNNDDDENKKKQPQLVISTNGDVTPFTIYVGKKGAKPRFAISGDADGNITSKELG